MYGAQPAGTPPAMGHNGGPRMMIDASIIGFNDAEQRTWSFFINNTQRIEREVYQIVYPDIRYQDLIPVDTSGGEWLQAVTYTSMDRVGQAQWFHAGAQDVPLVGLTRNIFSTSVQMAAIGYGYNEEELAVATQLGTNLSNDKAQACRRAAEEFVDRVAFNGDTARGFQGLLNNSSVTAAGAAQVGTLNGTSSGTAASALWANKTADQILADLNSAITGMWTASSGVELADTILLPQAAYVAMLTTPRSTTSDTTVMEFINRANIFTAETGRQLSIRGLWGLNTAGSGGTGRIVAYRRDPAVLKLYMPMPFRFGQPWRKGPMMYEVPGFVRLGGLDIRRPGAVRYLDGVV